MRRPGPGHWYAEEDGSSCCTKCMTNQPAQSGALDGLGRRGRAGRGLAKARARRGERRTRRRRRRLVEGRIKAKPSKKAAAQPVHIRRLTPDGKLLPCLPHVKALSGATGGTRKTIRPSASRSRRGSRAGTRPVRPPDYPGASWRRVWSPRPWSTRTACCTEPGKTSRSGGGQNEISSMTRIRPESRARVARSGTSHNSGRSCNAPDLTGSSRCGCSKQPQACGGASWRRSPRLLDLAAGTLTIGPPASSWTARSSSRTARPRTPSTPWRSTRSPSPCSGCTWRCSTRSGKDFGPDYHDTAGCSAGRTARRRTPTRSLAGSSGSPRRWAARNRPARRTPQLRDRRPEREDRLEGAQPAHRPRRRCVHHAAVRADRPGSRPRGCEHLADLIVGGLLVTEVDDGQGDQLDHGGQDVNREAPCTNPCTKYK